jgi:carotenoid cleavage dioxygenase-like enzyme
VLDTAAERSRLTVFDAAAVDAGPVFEAQLDRALPLGFHGSFKAAS